MILFLLYSFLSVDIYIYIHIYIYIYTYIYSGDLDFFRGDPGTKYTPFFFDDGDASELEVRKMEAFLDVAEEETMTRERWGASKFVKNQLRLMADNLYEPDVMPDIAADVSVDGSHALITVLQNIIQ